MIQSCLVSELNAWLKPVDLLNFKPGGEQVCMKKPVCVQKAATFIIDSKLVSVALAAAEDICVLPDYLDWVSKTKKSCNVSQLISDALPKNGGEKST